MTAPQMDGQMYCVGLRSVLCILGFAAATQGVAEEDQGTRVSVKGTAPATCGFTLPAAASSASNAALDARSGGAVLEFGDLLDPATALLRPASATVQFAATCNVAHRVVISSVNGQVLTSGVTAGDGFQTRLAYRLGLLWADAALEAGGGVAIADIGGAHVGVLRLSIALDSVGSTPVLAGQYTDTITIQLSARY